MSTIWKKLLIPAALIGTAIMFWSFGWPPILTSPPLTVYVSSTQNDYRFTFLASSLPTPADLKNSAGVVITPAAQDFDDWRVCATFNDGTFWMGDKKRFDLEKFSFATSSMRKATVELTPTYDDGSTNPPARTSPLAFATKGPATAPSQRLQTLATPQTYVRLLGSLNPRAGNILTYIITYQNPLDCASGGNLEFYFDDRVIVPSSISIEQFEPNQLPNPNITAVSAGTNIKKLLLPFNLLTRGQQRNIFIRCRTQSNSLPASTAYNKPFVNFVVTSGCPGVTNQSSTLSSEKIVSSHDPNHKMVAEQDICLNQDSVTFTVSFQNDGPGATQNIVVTDELHQLLKNEKPRLVDYSTNQPPSVLHTSANRQLTFTFNLPTTYPLHGLHETGLGTAFSVADTRANFTFRSAVAYDSVTTRSCNAILNQAAIRFDCNPEITTGLATANLRCTLCDTCTTLADTTIFVNDTLATGDSVVNSSVGNMLSVLGFDAPGTRYMWYPGADLDKPSHFKPVFNNPKHFAYTLVASHENPCQRRALHLEFNNPCNLGIQVNASGLTVDGCTGKVSGQLTATVTGNTSGNLKWQNCQSGPSYTTPAMTNSLQLEYYFGVTDQITGCTAELTYVVTLPPCSSSGTGTSWPIVITAVTAGVILLGGIRRRLAKKK